MAEPLLLSQLLWQRAAKRAMDIGGALSGLLLLAPLMLGISVLVAMRSGRPVLYRERRIGRGGRPFTLFKFRTLNPGGAAVSSIAPEDDPRITAVGLPLRRTRLDELPQLYNVRVGDMSLVGPRPMTQRHLGALDSATRDELLAVRPGVTDAASVLFFAEDAVLAGRPDAEAVYLEILLPAKAQVQLDYLRLWNLALDVRVIFRTLARVWSPLAREDSMRRVRDILAGAADAGGPTPVDRND